MRITHKYRPNIESATIFTSGGSGTQTPGTDYVKLTQFDTNGAETGEMTPDAGNNKITVEHTGVYQVFVQASFSGSANTGVMMQLYWNGVAQSQCAFSRALGSTGDVGSASAMGLVVVTSPNTDFDVRLKTSVGSKVVDVKEAQLVLLRLARVDF